MRGFHPGRGEQCHAARRVLRVGGGGVDGGEKKQAEYAAEQQRGAAAGLHTCWTSRTAGSFRRLGNSHPVPNQRVRVDAADAFVWTCVRRPQLSGGCATPAAARFTVAAMKTTEPPHSEREIIELDRRQLARLAGPAVANLPMREWMPPTRFDADRNVLADVEGA